MDKRKQLEETRQDDRGLYADLCYAVVAQACRDYRVALKAKRREVSHARDMYAAVCARPDYTIKECERFFRHDLDLWCDLDGEWIIREIRKRVE